MKRYVTIQRSDNLIIYKFKFNKKSDSKDHVSYYYESIGRKEKKSKIVFMTKEIPKYRSDGSYLTNNIYY